MACVPFLAGSRERAAGNSAGTFPRIAREHGAHLVCCARELDRLLAVHACKALRCLKDGAGPRNVTRSPPGELPRPSPMTPGHVHRGGALSHAALVPGLPGSRLAGPKGIRSHDRAYRRVRAPGPISGPITDGEEEHPSSGTQSAEYSRLLNQASSALCERRSASSARLKMLGAWLARPSRDGFARAHVSVRSFRSGHGGTCG